MSKNKFGKLIAVVLLLAAFVALSLVMPGKHNLKCGECDGTGMTDAAVCEACAGSGVGEEPAESNYYSTLMALAPPIIAIVLALVTKEVYSSLFIGILAGALLYSNFNVVGAVDAIVNEGLIANVADSWNAGILVFLVLLGIMVALVNSAGGSAAFGRWAKTHVKTKTGAQLATFALGVLIFIDDYFNCLTVGSVMRPVTDTHKVSRAKLVYDKSIKAPGIMRFYDMVAFDEIQTITFSDNSEMQSFLKNYLEYGRATIDNYEFMSECGLMLLGNILLNDSNEPISHNYFDTLPEVFRESALLDRFHGMIEGWLLPRVNVDMALHDWTLNVEFFSEVLHQLRTESSYSHIVDDLVEIPNGADMRHTKAVKRTATAYLKLLFPHITSADQIDKSEFNALCLQPAIRRRDIVRQQCSNIDAEKSFSKPMPDYRVVGL